MLLTINREKIGKHMREKYKEDKFIVDFIEEYRLKTKRPSNDDDYFDDGMSNQEHLSAFNRSTQFGHYPSHARLRSYPMEIEMEERDECREQLKKAFVNHAQFLGTICFHQQNKEEDCLSVYSQTLPLTFRKGEGPTWFDVAGAVNEEAFQFKPEHQKEIIDTFKPTAENNYFKLPLP